MHSLWAFTLCLGVTLFPSLLSALLLLWQVLLEVTHPIQQYKLSQEERQKSRIFVVIGRIGTFYQKTPNIFVAYFCRIVIDNFWYF